MKFFFLVLCTTILLYVYQVKCYKPVILMHGILSSSDSMLILKYEIEKNHPGTVVYNLDEFDGWYSLENAWKQVLEIGDKIKSICAKHKDGVHLLGNFCLPLIYLKLLEHNVSRARYSQGGILARAILQSYPEHNVKNFISLSSPQAGQFGTSFLHLIFPDLAAKTAFELFYSRVGQHTSVGNYWNDPMKQSLYFEYSVFLPLINNEITTLNSTQFKSSITKLSKLILIGGPNDGVITPWQSSHFGYFNETLNVVPFKDRDIYVSDKIGLRTLNEQKRLVVITRSNVPHIMWHTAPGLIKEIILPYLD